MPMEVPTGSTILLAIFEGLDGRSTVSYAGQGSGFFEYLCRVVHQKEISKNAEEVTDAVPVVKRPAYGKP